MPAYKRTQKNLTLYQYKKEKVSILHQLGYGSVTIHIFDNATNEIAVDNIARKIIEGKVFKIQYPTPKEFAYE